MKSQSYIYNKTKVFHSQPAAEVEKQSQSRQFLSENTINVVIFDNRAYWIKDNAFFSADVIDGNIAKDNVQEIQTDSMSKDDMDKMLLILDKLRGNHK